MGVPRPTRDKAEGDRDTVAPEAAQATRVSESQQANVQDRVPGADDIDLEATPLQRSTGPAGVDEWRQAQRRFSPGLDEAPGEEAAPVRGPSASAGTGRVVTERETVSDDEADADATARNPARTTDDPDAT